MTIWIKNPDSHLLITCLGGGLRSPITLIIDFYCGHLLIDKITKKIYDAATMKCQKKWPTVFFF